MRVFDFGTETVGKEKKKKVVMQCKGFFLERGIAEVRMIRISIEVI